MRDGNKIMVRKWIPYHWQIALAEEEVPMDKGGFRTVMIDIEKVIKGLTAHADGCGYRSYHCEEMECPYFYGEDNCDVEGMCRDAIALLKYCKAVVPKVSCAEQRCGNCNKIIEMDGWKACPWCGKAIDWEVWWKKNEHREDH